MPEIFLRLLGNGKEFGLKHINYTYQEGEGGIADALRLAEFFAAGEKICVVLGDNLIEKNIRKAAKSFRKSKRGSQDIYSKKSLTRSGLGFLNWREIGSSGLKRSRKSQNQSMR